MIRLLCLSLPVLMLLCVPHTRATDPQELFFHANVQLAEGNYDESIAAYQKVLALHPSARVHHNLGEAYHRIGEHGRARLHWERSLRLQAGLSEPRQRLSELRLAIAGLDPEPSWYQSLWTLLSYNHWLLIFSAGIWTALTGTVLAIFLKRPRLHSLTFAGSISSLLALLAILSLHPGWKDAIVIEADAALLVAPTPDSPLRSQLIEAEKVRTQGEYGEYLRVRRHNGQEGFVSRQEVARIFE